MNAVSSRPHVVVTSATSRVGRMLLPQLQAHNYRVTALVRQPAQLPADEVITDWMASPHALQALKEADVIIHLSGEIQARNWQGYYASNVQPTERVAAALGAGRARRSIFISYPNADPKAANLFLRAKGMAEQLLINSGKEAVIFRVLSIINTPEDPGPAEQALIAKPGATVRTLGSGMQPIFTIYRPDVVTAVMQAVERGRPGIYDLTGPDRFTMDGLIHLLNRNAPVKIVHTPAWLARLLSRVVPDLPPSFVDLYFQEYKMDGTQAIKEFDLAPTSLQAIWKSAM